MAETDKPPVGSTRKALLYVYLGYSFRYLYLLVLIPFYARVLGADEYGRLVAALSLFQVVWLIVEYGFPIIGARDAATRHDATSLGGMYSRQMAGRLLLSIPAIGLGVAGTLWSPLLREAPLLGVLATLNGCMAACNLGWFFQGTLRFKTSVILEMIGFAINLPLIVFFVHGPGDAWIVMLCLVFSSTVCTGAAHAIAIRSMKLSAPTLGGAVALVRESTVLFVYRGLSMLMNGASPLVMSVVSTAAEVGMYGAAERLVNVALSLLAPAAQVLTGTVTNHVGRETQQQAAYTLMRRSFFVLVLVTTFMTITTWIIAVPLVRIIFGESFLPAVPMLNVLSAMFPFCAFSLVASSFVLIPFRFDRWVSLSSLFGAVITLVLLAWLGQTHGGIGAAWARTAAQAAMSGLLLYALIREGLFEKILGRGARRGYRGDQVISATAKEET